jgi:peptide-methionine (S)-S-oxide reductase
MMELRGVEQAVSGYAGGHVENPSYEAVCRETTGHAEVVQVSFDPDEITYRELLEVLFALHDPTTKDREGADIGSQYRSAIFYHNDKQRATAESLVQELEGDVYTGIVTEIEPLESFYEAESYHQNYYEKNPDQPYCAVQIPPKLQKVREKFADYVVQREA